MGLDGSTAKLPDISGIMAADQEQGSPVPDADATAPGGDPDASDGGPEHLDASVDSAAPQADVADGVISDAASPIFDVAQDASGDTAYVLQDALAVDAVSDTQADGEGTHPDVALPDAPAPPFDIVTDVPDDAPSPIETVEQDAGPPLPDVGPDVSVEDADDGGMDTGPAPPCTDDVDCVALAPSLGSCLVPVCLDLRCAAAPVTDGLPCDDGSPCTLLDVCQAGVCQGQVLPACSPEELPESAVVINEIHYDPPDNTTPLEFVELTNRSSEPVDLSGYSLDDAVELVIPQGVSLAPGALLVLAQDPAAMLEAYGVTALGPWEGKLSSEGETLVLRDATGKVVDEVDYRVGFPWPVAPAGTGSSMELINPDLDNGLGGSWRASKASASLPDVPQVLLPPGDSGWSYWPGTSAPDASWKEPGYAETPGWIGPAKTPIGYGDGDDATVLGDMQGSYTTVYLRHPFFVGEVPPEALLLGVYVDDGAIVYLNGKEVARLYVSSGDKAWTDTTGAPDHEAAWKSILLGDLGGLLVPGSNLLAIHALNVGSGSSDLSIDATVTIPSAANMGGKPTPGAGSSVYAKNAPPQSRKVAHSPQVPKSGEDIVITAKVSDPDGVAAVSLEVQVVAPGAYVPSHLPVPLDVLQADPTTEMAVNPAYADPASWTTLPMHDDGKGGDAVAGDLVFSAVIPGQDNRTLVRYRITVEDLLGASVRVPYEDDGSLDFACFVYDGVPDYGSHPAEVLTALPVYFLLARGEDVAQVMAYESSDQLPQFVGSSANEARFVYNWSVTFVYDGVVYDNIRFRLRGGNGRYTGKGKRSFRFHFNLGTWLAARDQTGALYPKRWRTLTTGKGLENHGVLTYDLNVALNNLLFEVAGVPAPAVHFAHLRVVDQELEAPDPWNGDFWGLLTVMETYDGRFLDAHGLPDGNLYKLINSKRQGIDQQRHQAPLAVSDGSDHDHIELELTGNSSVEEIRESVRLDRWYAYHAIAEAVRHYDYWPDANKNAAWYFEPPYTEANGYFGRMWTLPFDSDASWGPSWNKGHDVVYNTLFPASGGGSDPGEHPELQTELYNVIREVRDLLWQEDQIDPLIQRLGALLGPFVAADRERWMGGPPEAGSYSGLSGAATTSFSALLDDLHAFAFVGGSWPGGSVGPGGRAAFLDGLQATGAEGGQIPGTPVLTYAGAEGHPTNLLAFAVSPFTDPQGDDTFAAMVVRVAEVNDPPEAAADPAIPLHLELQASWTSGELTEYVPVVAVPATAVTVGHAYRARARFMDVTGRWGHWSAPVSFVAGPPDDVQSLVAGLRITEVMYHPLPTPGDPTDESEYEFVELANVGQTTLPLSGVRLSGGVEADLSVGPLATLSPGDRVVVVRNQAAFEARYGGWGAVVAGEWSGKLDNAGEELELLLGDDVTIQAWSYDDEDGWPERADGLGSSLEVVDLSGDWDDPSNWRASAEVHGSPGYEGTGPLEMVVINEVVAAPGAWSAVELRNLTGDVLFAGGWILSAGAPMAGQLVLPPGTLVPPHGHLALDASSLALDGSAPGHLWLLWPDGDALTFLDDAPYGAQKLGEPWARWPDGEGPLYPELGSSLGATNAGPRVGPLVLSELMVEPKPPSAGEKLVWAQVEADDFEYVEVTNPTEETVGLGGWLLSGGIDLEIPPGVLLGPGESVAVVSFDAGAPDNGLLVALFRERYGLDEQVALVGGYAGKLRDGGESVVLMRPGAAQGAAPLLEDRVDYSDGPPWPSGADGTGMALHRVSAGAWGVSPVSFVVGPPTPGEAPAW